MKIETKLSVGQKAYVIHNESTYRKMVCPTCDGEGYVMICSILNKFETEKHQTMCCPECHGSKIVYGEKVSRYSVEEVTVKGIKLSVREKMSESGVKQPKVYISYKVQADHAKGELSYPEYENMIFASEKDACSECVALMKRANKKKEVLT